MNKKTLFFLVVLLFAVWWGGFTFYASVVVPQGMQVLGDHVKMGLITQSVTNYLNATGTIVLLISLVILVFNKDKKKNYLRSVGWEWFVLVLLQAVLFYIHSILSSMIHITQDIQLQPGFYNVHRVYLLTSTAMWLLIPLLFYRLIKLCSSRF